MYTKFVNSHFLNSLLVIPYWFSYFQSFFQYRKSNNYRVAMNKHILILMTHHNGSKIVVASILLFTGYIYKLEVEWSGLEMQFSVTSSLG